METNISFDEFSRRYNLGLNCSRRIVKEVQIAIRSWALFNAMNGNEKHTRNELRSSLEHLMMSDKMTYMRLVMAFDTIMAIFRVTDQKSTSKSLNFCNLVSDLTDAKYLDEMILYVQKKFSKLGENFEKEYEDKSRKYVKEYLEVFPLNWKHTSNLTNRKILTFREQYKPMRDNVLAHSSMFANLAEPTINELNEVVNLLVTQASQVHYIYSGNYEKLNEFSDIQHEEALELWNLFEEGLSRVVGD